MASISSNLIKVYPSGYRDEQYNFDSFVNSEENLNEIASRLVYNKSYIAEEDGTNIKFVIKGYLFSTTKSAITSLFSGASTDTIVYASVTTRPVQVPQGTYSTLVPYGTADIGILDVGGEFLGVDFASGQSVPVGALALYKKTSTGWDVIEESKLIFSTEQIQDGSRRVPISEEIHLNRINSNVDGYCYKLPSSSSLTTDETIAIKEHIVIEINDSNDDKTLKDLYDAIGAQGIQFVKIYLPIESGSTESSVSCICHIEYDILENKCSYEIERFSAYDDSTDFRSRQRWVAENVNASVKLSTIFATNNDTYQPYILKKDAVNYISIDCSNDKTIEQVYNEMIRNEIVEGLFTSFSFTGITNSGTYYGKIDKNTDTNKYYFSLRKLALDTDSNRYRWIGREVSGDATLENILKRDTQVTGVTYDPEAKFSWNDGTKTLTITAY